MTDSRRRAAVRKLRLKAALVSGFANIDGAIFLFVFLRFISPTGSQTSHTDTLSGDVALFIGYLVVACLLMSRWLDRMIVRRLQWYADDRPPTPKEARAVLRVPLALATRPLVAWAAAAVLFSGLAVRYDSHTAGEAVVKGVAIFEAGLVSAGLSYLLIERLCRPMFAAVLAAEASPSRIRLGVPLRLLLAWMLGSALPLAALLFLPLSPDNSIDGAVVALAGYGLLIGLATTLAAAHSVADPLREVRKALKQVQAGRLDVSVPVNDSGDIGMLQSGVNQMVQGMRERQRLADLFGRHVGADVAQQALEQGTGLESELRNASVLFVDLIGSTAMAEVLPPHEVVATLNAFFDAVVRVVDSEGGWVNKFEGDGAMCVFGAPAVQPDHAARALRAARRLHAELGEVGAAHPGLDAGIGVSSGQVVAGNVGTETRYEYTLLGGPVNEAARLSDLAKRREGRVLASAVSVTMAGDEGARWADVGTVALRGKSAPTAIREPATVVRVS